MTKYPVFRSLYKPLLMAGVPLLFLFAEIIAVLILVVLRLYVLILLVIPVHIIAARCYRKDPYEKRRKTDADLEEKPES